MQILITPGSLARTRVLHVNRWQLGAALFGLVVVLMLLSGAIYNLVLLKAVREGWPVVSQLVRLVTRDEFAQRDRFMRENLDAMAQKIGEVQAKLIKLEAMGERVSTAVGVKPDELKPVIKAGASSGGQGGPFVPFEVGSSANPSLYTLNILIYEEAFQNLRFGIATAAALLQFVFILVISLMQIKLIRPKWSY